MVFKISKKVMANTPLLFFLLFNTVPFFYYFWKKFPQDDAALINFFIFLSWAAVWFFLPTILSASAVYCLYKHERESFKAEFFSELHGGLGGIIDFFLFIASFQVVGAIASGDIVGKTILRILRG